MASSSIWTPSIQGLPEFAASLALNSDPTQGAALVGYRGTTVHKALDVEVNVLKAFGAFLPADPTGVADSTGIFLAVRDYLQTGTDYRGGVMHVPAGQYKLGQTLAFTAYTTGQVHNIILRGDGPQATVLNFTTAAAGSDGVTFDPGAHFGVENLSILGAKRDGLSLNPGGTPNIGNYSSYFNLRNIRIQQSGRDNFRCVNAFLGGIEGIWAKDAAAIGFNIQGFCTTLKVENCGASGSGTHGWRVNGVIYSNFTSCGSDDNTLRGWDITNCSGVDFVNCGWEANGQEGFLLSTSNSSVGALSAAMQDIKGVTLSGCYSIGNSKSAPASYANFVAAASADGRPLEFMIKGGRAYSTNVNERAIVLNAASGRVVCRRDLLDTSSFSIGDVVSANVDYVNLTVQGRRLIATLSADQSLTSGTAAVANLNTASVNDLGATIVSSQIVIPRGVNKIRVTACANYAANATGIRQLITQKNNTSPLGMPTLTELATSAGSSILNVSSPPISVSEGDSISMQVFQNSGGALNLSSTNTTFLCVEALG